jgi:hypothetical protein
VAFFAEHELPAELSTRRVLLPQSNACSIICADQNYRPSSTETITMIAILTFSDSHPGVAVRRRVSSP